MAREHRPDAMVRAALPQGWDIGEGRSRPFRQGEVSRGVGHDPTPELPNRTSPAAALPPILVPRTVATEVHVTYQYHEAFGG